MGWLPGAPPRKPSDAEIEQAKVICDGYPCPAPKCCDTSGELVADSYPEEATIVSERIHRDVQGGLERSLESEERCQVLGRTREGLPII